MTICSRRRTPETSVRDGPRAASTSDPLVPGCIDTDPHTSAYARRHSPQRSRDTPSTRALEELGERLVFPEWLEDRRDEIGRPACRNSSRRGVTRLDPVLTTGSRDRTILVRRCHEVFAPQSRISTMTGSSDSPSSVNEYSTRTGFSLTISRFTSRFSSRSSSASERTLLEMPSTSLLERVEPERSVLEQSMDDDGVPLLPISVAVEVIGHQSSPEHTDFDSPCRLVHSRR